MANKSITDLMLPDNERAIIAQAFMKSGLFSMGGSADHPISAEVQLARAYVKVQAGYEHGFQPFYAMQNFNIIKGKVAMSAEAIGTKIKSHKRYDFSILKQEDHDDQHCKIQFYKDGKADYVSAFTIADAKRAGLYRADSGWTKYPRAMLYARALTQGARIVCPEAIMGAITEDEAEEIRREDGDGNPIDSIDLLSAPLPEDKEIKGSEKEVKEGSAAENKAAGKKRTETQKRKTATAEQAAEGEERAEIQGVGPEVTEYTHVDAEKGENGLFEGQENENEGGKNYPDDLPFDPSTIKDLSRFFKQIHTHCGISPNDVWPILGVKNNPDLMEKYPILADAFIKVWDHYTISKSKS